MNKWACRWEALLDDFASLKAMTKAIPAPLWTPEYGELAGKIHSMGRDHFHMDFVKELLEEKKREESPVEEAYRAMCKVQAMFPHCPWCGRRLPGHCTDDCAVVKLYAAVREERGE